MRFFDPLPVLTSLTIPVLAVLGSNDKSVDARSAVAKLETLRRDGHTNITVKVYAGVGHSLQSAPLVFGRYAPGYLDFIADWAREAIRKGKVVLSTVRCCLRATPAVS